ncbi:MAG: cell division protein ZapA [Alistipes sp.]
MGKQAIKLKIMGKPYGFTIDSEKEELYRLAEREVNNNLISIQQQNIKNWVEVDYLGMTALKFAIENVNLRQSRNVSSDELKSIEQIDAEINSYLNTIKG